MIHETGRELSCHYQKSGTAEMKTTLLGRANDFLVLPTQYMGYCLQYSTDMSNEARPLQDSTVCGL